MSNSNDDDKIPFTRDCAPFLLNILRLARLTEEEEIQRQNQGKLDSKNTETGETQSEVRLAATVNGKSQAFVALLGGGGRLSMNATFGDPCPGTSKRLTVHYMVTEIHVGNQSTSTTRTARFEKHHVSFAEHEPVRLRRRLVVINTVRSNEGDDTDDIAIVTRPNESPTSTGKDTKLTGTTTPEVILPMILPYLDLFERIQCRIICQSWKKVIQEWGDNH